MMGTLGKGDKSVIQRKLLFKFYNNGFISTSNSEQEEQTNREKYVFYCSVSLLIHPLKCLLNVPEITFYFQIISPPCSSN